MPAMNSSSSRGLGKIVLLALALTGCAVRSSGPVSGEASIRVAEAALNGGSPQVALQVAQHILNRSPDDVPALLARGDALTQLGQNDEAIGSFERVLRMDRGSIRGQIGLGRIRLTTDPTEAANLFRAVLRAEPNNAIALTDLGIALDLLGRHTDAHPYYRQALMSNPGNVAVQVNLALSLAMTGDTDNALRIVEPLAKDRTAPVKLRHNYAAILTMAGRDAEAKQLLRQDMASSQVNEAMAGYRHGTSLASVRPAPETAAQAQPAPTKPVAFADVPRPTVAAKTETASAVLASTPTTPAPMPVVHTPSQTTETLVVTQTSVPLNGLPATERAFGATVPVPLAPVPLVTQPEQPASTPEPVRQATGIVPSARVQLGAFDSEAAAVAEWKRLQKRLPGLLADRQPAITSIELRGVTFWRLRTGGFDDRSAASDFCSQVRPKKAKCLVYAS
jgi:Flp pilus assembly protein TadD